MISAANESDLHAQLASAGLELVDCSPLTQKTGGQSMFGQKIKIRDLIQLFMHMEQIQSAGVTML